MSRRALSKVRRLRALPAPVAVTKARRAVAGGVLGRLYVELNHDPRSSVLIAGTHRSGSTWLADVINASLGYRLVFEPVRHSRPGEPLRSVDRRYLAPCEARPEIRDAFVELLAGTRRDYHLDRHNTRLLSHGRLLKTVSANLLLGWLRAQFPDLPIVFVIRGPLLVVSSCVRMDWLEPREPAFWLSQEPLMHDHLEPYRDAIASASTDAEKFAIEWCVLNRVVLDQFADGAWQLVRYEELVREPQRELERIFAYLDRPLRPRSFRAVERRSHTTEETLASGAAKLEKWRGALSDSEVEQTMAYVTLFGLERFAEIT